MIGVIVGFVMSVSDGVVLDGSLVEGAIGHEEIVLSDCCAVLEQADLHSSILPVDSTQSVWMVVLHDCRHTSSIYPE